MGSVGRPAVVERWRTLLDQDPAEREVQRFLEQYPSLVVGDQAGMPLGGLVFPQPRLHGLGARQFPDFLWFDTTGGVLTPVLIEIERPEKAWFTKRGDLTAQYHQAHQQLGDWRAWFLEAENQLLFRRTYVDWLGDFRSLVLATDAWLGWAILKVEQPFHPIGLAGPDAEDDGLDMSIFTTVTPSYADVLEVRAGRVGTVRDFLGTITADELASTRRDPWAPEYPKTTLSCLHVILEEDWEHYRYAVRDLDAIEAESGRMSR